MNEYKPRLIEYYIDETFCPMTIGEFINIIILCIIFFLVFVK